MSVEPSEMRGVGIQVTKLDSTQKKGSLQAFLAKQSSKPNKAKEKKPTEGESVLDVPQPGSADVKNLQKTKEKREVKNSALASLPGPSKAPIKRNIFEPIKVENQPSLLPPICELDPEVIKELPEDIQKEMLAQYGAKTLPGLVSKSAKQEKKNLFSKVSTTEVRRLVGVWVETQAAPKKTDVAMLNQHLCSLVRDRRIEELDVILKCFWRCVRNLRKDTEAWVKSFNKIVEKVQIVMVEFYSFPLHVDPL